jgi:hypothetical protein
VVFSLAATPGQSISAAILLAPGQYSVVFSGPASGITQPLNFAVHLASLADSIGPLLVDTTSAPLYQSPTDPRLFVYPTGVITNSFYLWLPTVF